MTANELIEKLLALTPEQRELEVWGDERDDGASPITKVIEHKFDDTRYSTRMEPG